MKRLDINERYLNIYMNTFKNNVEGSDTLNRYTETDNTVQRMLANSKKLLIEYSETYKKFIDCKIVCFLVLSKLILVIRLILHFRDEINLNYYNSDDIAFY